MATVDDVAGAAGVSTSTASSVLSGKRPISAATRLHVERSIRDLAYRPHAGACALSSNRIDVIGLTTPLRVGVNVSIIMQFVTGVVAAARAFDHDVLLLTQEGLPGSRPCPCISGRSRRSCGPPWRAQARRRADPCRARRGSDAIPAARTQDALVVIASGGLQTRGELGVPAARRGHVRQVGEESPRRERVRDGAAPGRRSVDSCPLQAVACTWLACLAVRRCPGRRVRRRASTQRPRAGNSTQSRCCDTIRSRSDTARATGASTETPRRHRTAHRHHASAGPRAAEHRLQKRREPTSSTPRIAS
ncbi:MAG: LacI family DNA-binding transcriptional regulator [Cellulomonas sp.]|nr:LacI family DNA-binding transcriptional regulator [Cellulomonas sp.]